MNANLQKKLKEYNWLKGPYGNYNLVDCIDFFDGNHVFGSFAANACTPQFDIDDFRKAFENLLARDDVQRIWIDLYSFDNDEDWPYADTAYISTSLSKKFFESHFGEGFPSEVFVNDYDKVFGDISPEFTLYGLSWD